MDRLADNAAAEECERETGRESGCQPRKARWEHPRLRRLATGEPREDAATQATAASRR